MTKRAALIGHPLKRRHSEIMHNAAFEHFSIDASYELREIEQSAIEGFVTETRGEDWFGFQVTAPFKRDVVEFLDEVVGHQISFAGWFAYGLPAAALLLAPVAGWVWLRFSPTVADDEVHQLRRAAITERDEAGPLTGPQVQVLVVFALILGGWLTQTWHGIHPGIVALAGALTLSGVAIAAPSAVLGATGDNDVVRFPGIPVKVHGDALRSGVDDDRLLPRGDRLRLLERHPVGDIDVEQVDLAVGRADSAVGGDQDRGVVEPAAVGDRHRHRAQQQPDPQLVPQAPHPGDGLVVQGDPELFRAPFPFEKGKVLREGDQIRAGGGGRRYDSYLAQARRSPRRRHRRGGKDRGRPG